MNPQTQVKPALQPPPKPATNAEPAIKASDLLAVIADETIRKQLEQQIYDEFDAKRRAAVLGAPPPHIEMKIRYGRVFGFNEVQSIEWIHLIPIKDGGFKPTVDYKGRGFLLKNAGYDWKQVQWSDTVAEFQFERNGERLFNTARAIPLDRLRAVLDEELSLLPEHYRVAVVLCYLEGLSREEVAERLGWSPDAVLWVDYSTTPPTITPPSSLARRRCETGTRTACCG